MLNALDSYGYMFLWGHCYAFSLGPLLCFFHLEHSLSHFLLLHRFIREHLGVIWRYDLDSINGSDMDGLES
jgi:hypothetical protein